MATLHYSSMGEDWLQWQRDFVKENDFQHVIFTDIADFYQRIYLHRIENTLDVATGKKLTARFVAKLIKQIRSKQSHGIPVGGSASRVLAEAVLSDTDSALADEEYVFTRYVDDYRIFIRSNQSPYQALAFMAEQLATCDGLALNAQKTRLMSIEEFKDYLNHPSIDVYDEAQKAAIDALSEALYFDEEPDQEEIDKLRSLNLLGLLEVEVGKEVWDFSRIRTIFRGLRVTENDDAVVFLAQRLSTFIPFIKELVLFFDAMNSKGKLNSIDLTKVVVEELASGAALSVPTIRVWLLELFVRGCLQMSHKGLSDLAKDETLSNRQVFIIRGLNGDVTFFRRNKARFEQTNVFEKFQFLLGATCLPEDEFRTWVSAIKTNMVRPLEALFCKWVLTKRGKLADVVHERTVLTRD
jgi:hypothetical protein